MADKYERLDRETLEKLLHLAHNVILGTTQDVLRTDAAYYPHLERMRNTYARAYIEALAPVVPLQVHDIITYYHYAAHLQPWNHAIPWNCPAYYDGCNCPGGPYYTRPEAEK